MFKFFHKADGLDLNFSLTELGEIKDLELGDQHNEEMQVLKAEVLKKVELSERKNNLGTDWICCGAKVNRHLIRYSVQLIISLCVGGFSIYQLSTYSGCDKESLYTSLLTMALSIYFPAPQFS